MPTEIYSTFNIIYYTVALVCPAVSLLRSFMIGLNVYSLACEGSSRAAYPGALGLYGGPILYLVIQIVVFIAFLMFWESGRSLEVFGIRSRKREAERETSSGTSGANKDAAEDEKHLAEANDGLRIHHVSKTFGANRAVDDVSFGVLPSEKMALLGMSFSIAGRISA